MSARTDFIALFLRQRRHMDAERREFARRAVAILRRNSAGEETFNAVAYTRTMRDLEPLLTEFYGAFPGDTRARFWRVILAESRAARLLAFQRSVALLRERVRGERGLFRAIEREAA